MRVLLLGATGLIGSAVASRLHREGVELIGVARRSNRVSSRVAVDRWVSLDLREALTPEVWTPYLADVDVVVNCAGVLQDNLRDSTSKVHAQAAIALWAACERCCIRRVVQVSAVGVGRDEVSPFSRSKRIGDDALMKSGLDWVILRPSVVFGRAAYGGTALLRSLAALPLLQRFPDAGLIDPIWLDDVTETIFRLLPNDAPSRLVLEMGGPERLTVEHVIARYRSWLGWPPARIVSASSLPMRLLCRIGDAFALLGWRPPLRTTARKEIERGAIADSQPWLRLTGIRPTSLEDALALEPASVQERWFAALYLLKPVMFGVFALYWLLTGIISLGPGFRNAELLLSAAGLGRVSGAVVVAGAIADIIVGLGVAFRSTARQSLIIALVLSLIYAVVGTMLLPWLWNDPLGSLLKIGPIMALNLACLAIVDER